MDNVRLSALLHEVRAGTTSVDDAARALATLPFRVLDGVATVDHHRHLRQGFPEVVLGQGKTPEQIATIMAELARPETNVLCTRVSPEAAKQVATLLPGVRHEPGARALVLGEAPLVETGVGTVLVVTAGTSDLPVAEEAALTARLMGNRVARLTDVGVAGLHRLLGHLDELRAAAVVIVIAGMEGALSSVVAGLVDRPVVAVPTSIGYGASFGGLAALLGMLSGCAAGVTVVNIDNGFGAAYAASLMNRGPR